MTTKYAIPQTRCRHVSAKIKNKMLRKKNLIKGCMLFYVEQKKTAYVLSIIIRISNTYYEA